MAYINIQIFGYIHIHILLRTEKEFSLNDKDIMAIKKKNMSGGLIAQVAHDAKSTFVAPRPLATNEAVRTQIVQETPPAKPLKKVCTIQKVGGFTFFTTEEDRNALDYILFRNKFEKQNVVRAALHDFLRKHYSEAAGLDKEALEILAEYENSIYQYV